MRLVETISVIAAAGMMAGCTSASGTVRQPSAPEIVPSERALVLPPPGGPSIVSVVETKHGNGVEQTLSLFTSSSVSGQNFLKARILGASGSNPGIGGVSYQTISESGISREAFTAVPGVAMVRNNTFLQNSYGPFGYAAGRSRGGDTCIYGWQQIRSSQAAHTQVRNFGMLNGEIWNPYGDVRGADEALGRTGSPIYPDDGGYRTGSLPIGYEPAPIAVRQATLRRVASPLAQAQTIAAQQAPIGPRVPLPDQPSEA